MHRIAVADNGKPTREIMRGTPRPFLARVTLFSIMRAKERRAHVTLAAVSFSACALLLGSPSFTTPHASDLQRQPGGVRRSFFGRRADGSVRRDEKDEKDAWKNLIAACGASLLLVACSFPGLASARDGRLSPPTCVAIIDAATNCPARPAVGAKKNAEVQLKAAEERLAAAEKQAGQTIEPGQSQGGEPEMVDFWKNELARLELNRTYMAELQEKMKSPEARLVSQLAIETSEVSKEEKFWCEALGMQRYKSLPDGAVLVGFGPPSLGGEEGAYFAIKISPSDAPTSVQASGTNKARLSFVQLTTPALIRISRVVSSGGAVVDGYGYYGVQSPAGVQVRAYVEDRRDPIELVALAVEPNKFEETRDFLKKLGLEERGPYKLVSPEMQAYMPPLPEGNLLFGSGDPKLNVQVLLLPEIQQQKESGNLLQGLGRGPTLLINEDSSWGVGLLDETERPLVPLSLARRPVLTLYGGQEPLAPETRRLPMGRGQESPCFG